MNSPNPDDDLQPAAWRRELIIAATLFAFGVFVLPLAIYWVGQNIMGEYAADTGVLGLAEHIWTDLLTLSPAAWLLVLSPYVVVQLGRAIRTWWRAPTS